MWNQTRVDGVLATLNLPKVSHTYIPMITSGYPIAALAASCSVRMPRRGTDARGYDV